MNVSIVPSEKRRWAEILAQQIQVGNASGKDGSSHRCFARTRKEAADHSERGESMSDNVHG